MERPTAKEMLDLIKKLPKSEEHIHICPLYGAHCVTSEFFAGNFAGISFEANSFEEAAEMLIDYMYRHIDHDSLVGNIVAESGFPDLNKVYEYCKRDIYEIYDKFMT